MYAVGSLWFSVFEPKDAGCGDFVVNVLKTSNDLQCLNFPNKEACSLHKIMAGVMRMVYKPFKILFPVMLN